MSHEGNNNFCYGSETACAHTSSQCLQDSDCAPFNVANAPRFEGAACPGAEAWEVEVCNLAAQENKCDDHQGCTLFKRTLRLQDLPVTVETATFRLPRYAAVTGDLKDLTQMTKLTTLSFANSPKITGELKDLTPQTALTHLDLGGSPLIRGDVADLVNTLKYANVASAKAVGGDIKDLPKDLVYANFRSALLFKGDVSATTRGGAGAGNCNLKELDLRDSVQGIKGKLTGAGPIGLFDRCASLTYVDLGSNYGTTAATQVVKGTFNFATNTDKCIKGNGLATTQCQQGWR